MTKTNSKGVMIFIVIFASVILSACIIMPIIEDRVAYTQAEDLMCAGKYSDALTKLKTITDKEYKNVYEMEQICKAHTYYEAKKFEDALEILNNSDIYDIDEPNREKLNDFKAEVQEKYDEYLEEQKYEERKREEKAQMEKMEYKAKVAQGVPFVGMSEADINKTSLGSASPKTRSNTEYINGKAYKATLYDFMRGGYVIFTARCVQGKVTEVFDKRDNPHKPYGSQSSSASSSSGKKKIPDDANDYDDPEDFYEENRDCFEDYDEAEDYWYDETEEW